MRFKFRAEMWYFFIGLRYRNYCIFTLSAGKYNPVWLMDAQIWEFGLGVPSKMIEGNTPKGIIWRSAPIK